MLRNWQSPIAKQFRSSILDGTYKYCDHKVCPKLSQLLNTDTIPDNFVTREEFERQFNITSVEDLENYQGLPETILFGFDRSCNLQCPSCRVNLVTNDSADSEDFKLKYFLLKSIEEKFSASLKKILVTGSGDPFYSKIYRDYLIHFDIAKYPKLQAIKIITNGNLLDEKMWDSLACRNFIKEIEISIDAGSKYTYEKVTRLNGRWERLLENIRFLSQRTTVNIMEFSMVVSKNNYKEMELFYHLIEQLCGNSSAQIYINYRQIVYWSAGAYTPEAIKDLSVFHESHPDFEDFLMELRKIHNKPRVTHNFHHLLVDNT